MRFSWISTLQFHSSTFLPALYHSECTGPFSSDTSQKARPGPDTLLHLGPVSRTSSSHTRASSSSPTPCSPGPQGLDTFCSHLTPPPFTSVSQLKLRSAFFVINSQNHILFLPSGKCMHSVTKCTDEQLSPILSNRFCDRRGHTCLLPVASPAPSAVLDIQ